MRHSIPLYLTFGLLLIFSSCSYKQDQTLFEKKNSTPDTAFQNPANISKYRIKPQDILQIINMQNNKSIIDLAAGTSANPSSAGSTAGETYLVEDDGTIGLTGLGRVQVAGLTRVEARKYIEQLYIEKFLKDDAIFDVKILNLKVTFFGEVKAAGPILLTKDRTTLVEAIGEAGGLTDKADEKTIKIIRENGQNIPKTEIIDLSDIRSLTDPRTILQNGDIIYISQNKKSIRNSDIQNFSVVIQPALILFNTALIIFTLIHK